MIGGIESEFVLNLRTLFMFDYFVCFHRECHRFLIHFLSPKYWCFVVFGVFFEIETVYQFDIRSF